MRKTLLSLALCGLASVAAAGMHEDAPLYEGAWTVRLTGERSARFELRDWSGTWRESGKALPPACRGKKMPATVQHSNPEELEFTVWGSSIHRDCPDTSYVFRPRGPKVLEAALPAGGTATMTRVRP